MQDVLTISAYSSSYVARVTRYDARTNDPLSVAITADGVTTTLNVASLRDGMLFGAAREIPALVLNATRDWLASL